MQADRAAGSWNDACGAIGRLDDGAMRDARALHARLTKPAGSLGRLEILGAQLAGIAGSCPPPVPMRPAVAVFAGDHGVVDRGVSAWPQEVTAQMVANFAAGGAAINVLARQVGASVTVVDVGVAGQVAAGPDVVDRRVRGGTRDFTRGAAMTTDEATAALDAGAEVAGALVDDGADILVTGEMGIGNTTAAAALICAVTGAEAQAVAGVGAGSDSAGMTRKVDAIREGLSRHRASGDVGPLATLAGVGGLEIAALVGFIVAGASRRIPVLIDGVIADAALLMAEELVSGSSAFCMAGHRSSEPGATLVLDRLGVSPILDLGLRLGEGTGACLAVPVVQAAARVMHEMATFDSAGITGNESQ